jgi:hypothetical protein
MDSHQSDLQQEKCAQYRHEDSAHVQGLEARNAQWPDNVFCLGSLHLVSPGHADLHLLLLLLGRSKQSLKSDQVIFCRGFGSSVDTLTLSPQTIIFSMQALHLHVDEAVLVPHQGTLHEVAEALRMASHLLQERSLADLQLLSVVENRCKLLQDKKQEQVRACEDRA